MSSHAQADADQKNNNQHDDEHVDNTPSQDVQKLAKLRTSSSSLCSDDAPTEQITTGLEDHGNSTLPILRASTGRLPYAYERALANRIELDKLEGNGRLSTDRFPAIFIYDTMMLPGSLAYVLSKDHYDTFNLVKRMTPAVVTGFHLRVHPETQQPCLIPSSCQGEYVRGMAVVGVTSRELKRINRHYGHDHKAVTLNVEVDVLKTNEPELPYSEEPKSTLERCKLWTQAWELSDAVSLGIDRQCEVCWSLEDFLDGKYDQPCYEHIKPLGL